VLTGWKTLDTQNNSLTIDPSQDDPNDHQKLRHGYNHKAEAGHLCIGLIS